MNIVEQIRRETRGFGRRPAIVDEVGVTTYEELLTAVTTVQGQLVDLGLGPKQRLAFCCRDSTDYVIGSLAVLATGAALVPLASSLTEPEKREAVERLDVHAILEETGGTPATAAAGEVRAGLRGTAFRLHHRPARDEHREAWSRLDVAFIRFSSGTTGASKGVVLSHQSILERTEAANRGLGISERDEVLWVLPMSHHFVVSILLFLRRAASIVLGHQAFPLSLAEVVSHRRVTFMYAAPLHYRLLASSPAVPCQALDRVRLAVSTAMQLPRETAEAFLSRFGIEIAEAYGIIEVGLPFINLAPRVSTRGSVGRPLPDYDLKLDHADPAGVGEVLIRGRGMFDAYFSPWQTRAECYPDGWFHTGDLGRLDAEGNLYLVGRDKTVINYAGLKVFPDEVEQVLNSHPQVCESLVYASADAQYGQVPTARVVPTGPAMAGEAFTEELRRWCFARLSAYKVPVRFELVQALRKTASGKLVRHA